jgi:serine phosphatase RsbU (regulator of sigma subunit)
MRATAPPIGVLPDLTTNTETITLQATDVVVCFSDRFTEIETTNGLWGIEGVRSCITDDSSSAKHITEQICVTAQSAGSGQNIPDDQTLVVVVKDRN